MGRINLSGMFAVLLGGFLMLNASGAEWQWSAEVGSIQEAEARPRAFLWIPPKCERVRAVVFAQNNMIEEGVLEHGAFRAELARLGIAELYVAPGFGTWQDAEKNDAENRRFNALLKTLAEQSGYAELESAPIIPMGHSAKASFPWNFAAWNQDRALAILSLKGDAPRTPLTGNGRPNADWGDRNIDGIPGLMVMNEFEFLEARLTPAVAFMERNPTACVAFLSEPGRGHFGYSDELVDYLAHFIRKAVEQRLAADGTLVPLDPKKGSATTRWRKSAAPGGEPRMFWTFDEEMARRTETFHARHRDKAPQMLGFVWNGETLDQVPDTADQVQLPMPTLDEALSFELGVTFLDAVAEGGNPSRWTGLSNGAPLGHAAGTVTVSRITGPVIQTAPDRFALRFNRSSMASDRRRGDIWLLAEHPGDENYNGAEQQARLRIPWRLTEGAAQKITFPKIEDVVRGVQSLELNAVSDSGLPVFYYVLEGPAEVEGNRLRFTPIPPRARFPVRVTVVAWQYGRMDGPKTQSAEPVARAFLMKY